MRRDAHRENSLGQRHEKERKKRGGRDGEEKYQDVGRQKVASRATVVEGKSLNRH